MPPTRGEARLAVGAHREDAEVALQKVRARRNHPAPAEGIFGPFEA